MTPERTEFHIDRQVFLRTIHERLFLRLGIATAFFCTIAFLVVQYVHNERSTFLWTSALALLFVYGAVEISSLQWAKRSAPVMVVRLNARALECWVGMHCHSLSWKELQPPKLRYRAGKVSRIDVRDAKGQGVQLAGFQDMDQLASAIVAQLAAR